jgi:hypothetical protein
MWWSNSVAEFGTLEIYEDRINFLTEVKRIFFVDKYNPKTSDANICMKIRISFLKSRKNGKLKITTASFVDVAFLSEEGVTLKH